MKFLSDMDSNAFSGKPMVEWEYAEGGRFWEEFETDEDRLKAIDENQAYNDLHADEVIAYFKAQDEWLEEMRKEFGD